MTDQLRRTWVLLDTLLDYLPGPQAARGAASEADAQPARARTYTMAELDRQLAHIEHQQRLRAGDYSRLGLEPLELARRDQYRAGDYAALDAALGALEDENAMRAGLAWRVATHHPGVLDRPLRVELVVTIRWLAERLPAPARVPEWTRRAAAPLPEAIAALRDLGVPYATLARVYGQDAATLRKRVRKASA